MVKRIWWITDTIDKNDSTPESVNIEGPSETEERSQQMKPNKKQSGRWRETSVTEESRVSRNRSFKEDEVVDGIACSRDAGSGESTLDLTMEVISDLC